MSSQNCILNCVGCVYGHMVDVKTRFVFSDVSRQAPYYRGDAA